MSRTRSSLRPLVALLVASLVVVGASVVDGAITPSWSAAQSDSTVDTRPVVDDANSPEGNILPRPNSGRAPDSPNDPGGWQQYMVFGLIVAGLGAIAGLVVRESRSARRTRAS